MASLTNRWVVFHKGNILHGVVPFQLGPMAQWTNDWRFGMFFPSAPLAAACRDFIAEMDPKCELEVLSWEEAECRITGTPQLTS